MLAVGYNKADKELADETKKDLTEEAMKDFTEAIRCCIEAIRINENNLGVYYIRGAAYFRKDLNDEAQNNIDEADRILKKYVVI